MVRADFDVGILGGGPAGSTLAAYLAQNGADCVVLEKELFPRPHVGESLVPSSTRIFRELGFLEQMEEAGFPHKYGAAWTTIGTPLVASHDWQGLEEEVQPTPVDIRFEEREQPGVDQLYTYHVDRGKFDNLLLQHAHRLGARVCEGLRVRQVDFDAGELPRIRARVGRKDVDFRVRLVVDATGRNTFLGRQLKLRITDPVFDQFALHTWFEGYDRGDDGKRDYIFIHFIPMSNTWVWQIPITESITSFGLVTQKASFAGSKASREDFFWRCVGCREELLDKLRAARQVRPFTEEADYSYAMSRIVGDRFLLIGDAARFVDPIFSSGVSVALNSARIAYPEILAALAEDRFDSGRFSAYEKALRCGTQNWYKFITLYYRLNILFTYFLSSPRHRLDVLKLLQGDVYDAAEPPVLEKMREAVVAVEQNSDHPWHGMLGDLTAEAFRNAF